MTRQSPQDAGTKAIERLKALTANLRRAAKHPGEEEAIHKLRVAIRRFTQVLRVFKSRFEHIRRMRHHLRGLMDLCGAVRNCDIAVDALKEAGVSPEPGLKRRLKRRRDRTARELADLLEDFGARSNLRHWRKWLKAKADDHAPAPALPPLEREFRRSGAEAARAGADFAKMHQFRLLVKRYRYTLEILGSNQARLTELRALQERLGAVNDCVTTAELIGQIEMPPSVRRRITIALNRLLARRSAEFRTFWRTQHGQRRMGRTKT